MRGRKLVIAWEEDEPTLKQLYRSEPDAELRTRWHALWLLRQGTPTTQTAELVGVHLRTVRTWLRWYRHGGVAAIRQHRHGGRQGKPAFLTKEQEQQLYHHTTQGRIMTVAQALTWVQQQFGVPYTYGGMRALLKRLRITNKVPRPLAEKGSLEAQEAWKKGGLPPR